MHSLVPRFYQQGKLIKVIFLNVVIQSCIYGQEIMKFFISFSISIIR